MISPRENQHVLVAGSPGAWVNAVSGWFEDHGWHITWPGQELGILHGELFLKRNRQNIEVHHMHRQILQELGVDGAITHKLPHPGCYDAPFPGPREFISKFQGRPAVVTCTGMPPFLDLWRPVSGIVIDIRATEQEDLDALGSWTTHNFSREYLKDIRAVWLERYDAHLKQFPWTFRMSQAEVRDQCFDGLERFLSSVL